VLELLLCLLPRVAPKHVGLFVRGRLGGVLDVARSEVVHSGGCSERAHL
jgi:hypothetical protein